MKIKYLLLLAVSYSLLYSSCSNDTFDPVVKLGAAPNLTAPTAGSSYVLTEDKAGDIFSQFTWTEADFGFQSAISYTVEIDKAGNNFLAPVTLGVVSKNLSLEGITNEKVNAILLAKELPGGAIADMEIRVKAKVSNDVDELISAAVPVKITPYEAVVDYPKLQVPGSYQGWDPGNTSTVIHSLKSDNKYEGFVYFENPNTEFKFTQGFSWTVNWGDDGADGTLDPNGANIMAPDAGMHRMNVDLNTLTYTKTPTNWGLIGSATPTGWDSDTDMVYDPATGHLKITINLVAGEIKFRANNDWAINFGDDGPNNVLEYNGANIAIPEAGNYTIELILNVPKYTYKIKKN